MKLKVTQPSTIIHQLAKRLHPKFRWLSYVCPIIHRTQSSSSSSSKRLVCPPEGPPRLRLRKRRLSVAPSESANRRS